MLAFWILVGLALGLALASLRGDRARAEWVSRSLSAGVAGAALRPATVIVPVKGADVGLAGNLAALAGLDYPDYELIVVARGESDVPEGVLPAGARLVLAGEGDPATGEKINNLTAGVRAARRESEILAFADSDGKVRPGWLRALAARLAEPATGLATGYRWHLPQPPDFASLLRSVWDSVVAGGFHGGDNAFAWGGAMAIRRDTFQKVRVLEAWKGAVSDDFRISEAVHKAGLRIAYAPGALVVSSDRIRMGELARWVERQMVLTRLHQPRLWWAGMGAHLIYCGAMAASAAVAVWGNTLAGEYALVAQLGLGMLKGANRAATARAALPEHEGWFDRHGWVLTWWVPLATWMWLYGFLASARTNVVSWRGNRYRVSRSSVTKL